VEAGFARPLRVEAQSTLRHEPSQREVDGNSNDKMKHSIPTPVTVTVIVVAVVGIALVLLKLANGPPEFAAPAGQNTKVIPKYIFQGMSPAMQKKMQADGYTVSDSTPQGQPTHPPG
jgi:hypothetical protein